MDADIDAGVDVTKDATKEVVKDAGRIVRGDDDRVPTPVGDCRARLLVADDDPAFRRAISFLLNGSGYDVTEARDGREALRVLAASWREGAPFEILLLDIRMDGATGWQVLRQALDGTPPGEKTPRALLVTGFAEEMDFARARREGAARLLVKPISCEVLLAEIARLQRIPRDIPAIHDAGVHLTTTG
jgi:two-component system sensor histidine kinase/response regulator